MKKIDHLVEVSTDNGNLQITVGAATVTLSKQQAYTLNAMIARAVTQHLFDHEATHPFAPALKARLTAPVTHADLHAETVAAQSGNWCDD